MPKKSKKYITRSKKETQKLAKSLAKSVFKIKNSKNALVLALEGELGSGKTTFTQGFANGLGIKEKILSPTFVILKRFQFVKPKKFKNFFHVDCYRIIKPEELLELNWRKIIYNPENIVMIEWADLVKKFLPKGVIKIKFEFINEKNRKITF